jgi:electron transport complex protein RnfB
MSDQEKGTEKGKVVVTRRGLLGTLVRGAGLLAIGGSVAGLAVGARKQNLFWQINPWKCNQCGNCAKNCVLNLSAVKCVHDFVMCGYCELCTGFFLPNAPSLDPGAENQLCPVGAIRRTHVEDPYYQYTIDESLCIGCGVCVRGCTQFGNGSLYLQVRHDRCLNCNECSIAVHCPAQAFIRLPSDRPYIIKHKGPEQI